MGGNSRCHGVDGDLFRRVISPIFNMAVSTGLFCFRSVEHSDHQVAPTFHPHAQRLVSDGFADDAIVQDCLID